MFRIHLINSKENEIRIFYYNHYLQNSAINDIYCPKNEIHEISIQLQNSISEINKNLHNRVQLFEQFKNQAQSLFMLCISDFIEFSNINEHENLIIQFEYDEDIGFIPFEFLFNGEYFLSEKFQINRKINGNSIKHEIPSESNFCLSGNFSDDLDIRKSVDNELSNISTIFDENKIQYNGPNVGPISDKSEIQNYFSYSNFIHFSGHFSNSKNKSGWKLNSESVFKLEDFKSLSHIPHFLFSNSCGNPSIDSSLNFFHELNKIGIKNIIYSTGEINTEFSKQFSVLFYEGIGEGKNISESLLNAKKKFIEKHGYSNPCWLQYNIIGNGNFSLKNKNTKINSKPLIGILFSLILITFLSFSFINFKSWYENNFSNKKFHIIPLNISEKLEIFDFYGRFLNPSKPLKIYNMDEYTFYSEGFDSLKLFFNIEDSVSINTDSPIQFFYNNDFLEVISLNEDSIFLNLLNNGLCEIEISNFSKNQKLFLGYINSIDSSIRKWEEIKNNPIVKLDPHYNGKLFLKIIQNNQSHYFEFNQQFNICDISINNIEILNRESKYWIYLGF